MMNEDFKSFIDESTFYGLLNDFRREGWTKKGKEKHSKLREYLLTIEGVIYTTDYLTLSSFNLNTRVWSTTKFDVPLNRRGYLKKYRGYQVLIVVLNQNLGYKREIGCFPIIKTDE